jgi:hypothetical protein
LEWDIVEGFAQDAITYTRTSEPNAGTHYFDSPVVETSAQNVLIPLDPAGSAGRTDYLNIRYRFKGQWSPVSSRAVVSQYSAPCAPLLVLTQQVAADGSGLPIVDIAVTNPPGVGGYADTTSTDLFRDGVPIATSLPNNSTFTDLLPGATPTYLARSKAASGGSAESY